MKTDKEKLIELFNELNLPICPASWADNSEYSSTYQILDGAAYITFDAEDKAVEYHGGYE